MRTAILTIFLSLWLAAAVYVAVLVLVSALRRGRHAWTLHPPVPSPRFPANS